MDDFNDEIDEFMWLCSRIKEYKRLKLDVEWRIRYVIRDMRDVEQLLLSYGEICRLDARYLQRKKGKFIDLFREKREICEELESMEQNLDIWNLGDLFNQ